MITTYLNYDTYKKIKELHSRNKHKITSMPTAPYYNKEIEAHRFGLDYRF